jgi:two-component system, OmpR family, sensor histidine kinase KdpD
MDRLRLDQLSRADLTRVAGMVAGVAAISVTIGLIEVAIEIPNLSILYLLVVMFCAVTWGWWNALAAAVLSFLAYDFLFVEPRFTFTIRDPQEWLALLIFLAVAAVTSNLAARERARREQASRQARTAMLLYELSRALNGDDETVGLRAVAERIISEFSLDGAVIARSDGGGRLDPIVAVGSAEGALGSEPVGRVFAPPSGPNRPGRWIVLKAGGKPRRVPVANFPLRRDGRQIGMLRLVGRSAGFADDETSMLATIADRLAVDLEQAALREEANRVEVLRRTDELRTALLSSVSHDLRTPLAAIKASAESLMQHDIAWSEEDREGFAGAIVRESDRLNRLVGNLLDMSRIEGGSLHPQRDWYDAGELIREVVARLRPLLQGRSVEPSIADDLPPVSLDYLMIDQVVTNLIENAVKYTPPGTPIDVRVERIGERVRVSIADHGPGIPASKRASVFDKFSRLERQGQIQGSGLGLAVSKGLVEGHGGQIWIEETAGGGATFVFELPLSEHVPTSPAPGNESVAVSAGPSPGSSGSGAGGTARVDEHLTTSAMTPGGQT